MRTTLLLGLLAIAGCSQAPNDSPPFHPVTGKVTLQGKPLETGQVSLNPEKDNPDLIINGLIQPGGAYTISSYQNGKRTQGVPVGKYHVSVHAGNTGNLPILYQFPKMFEVTAKENQWDLELSKAKKQ